MPPQATRTIFVANIPYDVSEEQLAGVFSDVGPVSNVEIKFDPATGRSKGYAFVQFYDEATASSAVRNLGQVEVNGRHLRVEASTDEPGPRTRQEGRGGGGGGGRRGGGGGGGRDRDDTPPGGGRYGGPPPPMGMGMGGPPPGAGDAQPRLDLGLLPPGVDVPPNMGKSTDAISKTLAAVSPGQMQDVMAGMKTLVMTQPEAARQLLSSKPQLAYALFQAMLLMNIVDASVLQRIQPIPAAPVPAYGAPQPSYPPYGAPPPSQPPYGAQQNAYRPPAPVGGPGYGAPPPAAGYGYNSPAPGVGRPPVSGLAGLPAQAQAALAGLPEDQKTMLVQVLQLTPDQIAALDPAQKASVLQLRQQFLG